MSDDELRRLGNYINEKNVGDCMRMDARPTAIEAENARLRARIAELEKFVSKAYCVACDAQAMATVRYNASPSFSPMPELKELEDAAHKLLEKPT